MNDLMAPGNSAPSAPAAQPGYTPYVLLPSLLPSWSDVGIFPANFFTPNPISQNVTLSGGTGTITNTTVSGHIFYPGTVTTTVAPSSSGSIVQTVGTGSGSYPLLNDVVGYLWFGFRNYSLTVGCNAPNPSLSY